MNAKKLLLIFLMQVITSFIMLWLHCLLVPSPFLWGGGSQG